MFFLGNWARKPQSLPCKWLSLEAMKSVFLLHQSGVISSSNDFLHFFSSLCRECGRDRTKNKNNSPPKKKLPEPLSIINILFPCDSPCMCIYCFLVLSDYIYLCFLILYVTLQHTYFRYNFKKCLKYYFILNIYLFSFIWLHQVLVAAHRMFDLLCGIQDFQLQCVGSSSLTRDQTWAPYIKSVGILATGLPGKP